MNRCRIHSVQPGERQQLQRWHLYSAGAAPAQERKRIGNRPMPMSRLAVNSMRISPRARSRITSSSLALAPLKRVVSAPSAQTVVAIHSRAPSPHATSQIGGGITHNYRPDYRAWVVLIDGGGTNQTNGNGILIIGGTVANNYAGDTTIGNTNAGGPNTLRISAGANNIMPHGPGTGNLIINGQPNANSGTFDLNGTAQTINGLIPWHSHRISDPI